MSVIDLLRRKLLVVRGKRNLLRDDLYLYREKIRGGVFRIMNNNSSNDAYQQWWRKCIILIGRGITAFKYSALLSLLCLGNSLAVYGADITTVPAQQPAVIPDNEPYEPHRSKEIDIGESGMYEWRFLTYGSQPDDVIATYFAGEIYVNIDTNFCRVRGKLLTLGQPIPESPDIDCPETLIYLKHSDSSYSLWAKIEGPGHHVVQIDYTSAGLFYLLSSVHPGKRSIIEGLDEPHLSSLTVGEVSHNCTISPISDQNLTAMAGDLHSSWDYNSLHYICDGDASVEGTVTIGCDFADGHCNNSISGLAQPKVYLSRDRNPTGNCSSASHLAEKTFTVPMPDDRVTLSAQICADAGFPAGNYSTVIPVEITQP